MKDSISYARYVDIGRPELLDLQIAQYDDRPDAVQLVQVICGQTGLPDLSPPEAQAGWADSAAASTQYAHRRIG